MTKKTARAWNGGLTGTPRTPTVIARPGACTTSGCGTSADVLDENDPTLHGWTRTEVHGSSEPPRWWCSGRCANYGVALAELRVESAGGEATAPGTSHYLLTMADRFARETRDHRMEIVHDDGLYRHLEFRSGTEPFYWFNIVTFPGSLVIRGGMGTFVFSCIDDMFEFFPNSANVRGVNLHYWAEKAGQTEVLRRYDEERVRALVAEHLDERRDRAQGFPDGLLDAIEERIFQQDEMGWEDGARELLAGFEHEGFRLAGAHAWDLTDWTAQFAWSCYAVMAAIAAYRAHHAAAPVAAGAAR